MQKNGSVFLDRIIEDGLYKIYARILIQKNGDVFLDRLITEFMNWFYGENYVQRKQTENE